MDAEFDARVKPGVAVRGLLSAIDAGSQVVLPESRVTGAFHHLSAVHLLDTERARFDCDVLVLGDEREATDLTRKLAERITGVRGVFAGRLRNAHQVEAPARTTTHDEWSVR